MSEATICEPTHGKPKQTHEIEGDNGLREITFTVAPMAAKCDTEDDD